MYSLLYMAWWVCIEIVWSNHKLIFEKTRKVPWKLPTINDGKENNIHLVLVKYETEALQYLTKRTKMLDYASSSGFWFGSAFLHFYNLYTLVPDVFSVLTHWKHEVGVGFQRVDTLKGVRRDRQNDKTWRCGSIPETQMANPLFSKYFSWKANKTVINSAVENPWKTLTKEDSGIPDIGPDKTK